MAGSREKDALADLNSAVRVWPKNVEALDLLSEKHFQSGQFDVALAAFKELEQAGAQSPQTAIKIAQCYTKMSQPKRAIEHLMDASKRFVDSPEILTEIGNIHSAKKDFAKARVAYDSALKANKTYEPAQLKIAQLLVKQAQVDKAMAYLNRALKDSPNSPLMNLGLANLQWQIAESSRVMPLMAKAEKRYRKTLALSPGLVDARGEALCLYSSHNKKPAQLSKSSKNWLNVPTFMGI